MFAANLHKIKNSGKNCRSSGTVFGTSGIVFGNHLRSLQFLQKCRAQYGVLSRCTVLYPAVRRSRQSAAANRLAHRIIIALVVEPAAERPFLHLAHELADAARISLHLIDAIHHGPCRTRPPVALRHRPFNSPCHCLGRWNIVFRFLLAPFVGVGSNIYLRFYMLSARGDIHYFYFAALIDIVCRRLMNSRASSLLSKFIFSFPFSSLIVEHI